MLFRNDFPCRREGVSQTPMGGEPPLFVEDDAVWDGEVAAPLPQCLAVSIFRRRVNADWVFQIVLLNGRFDGVGFGAAGDVDTDQDNTRSIGGQVGGFRIAKQLKELKVILARRTPSRPKVHDHDLAAKFLDIRRFGIDPRRLRQVRGLLSDAFLHGPEELLLSFELLAPLFFRQFEDLHFGAVLVICVLN